MQCTKPIRLMKNQTSPTGLLVPCGKCLACRIQKRKEWSLRVIHEMEDYNDSTFVTLTYSDNHLPDYESIRKLDLQKFFKRLRFYASPRKLKYFACGEYGPTTGRPHYHSIIFGLSLSKSDKKLVIDSWPYCDWSNSHILKESFKPATIGKADYVAGYIHQKLSGDLLTEFLETNREPTFRISSQGIGKNYVDRNCEQLQKTLTFTVNGVPRQLPRYYLNRLGMDAKTFNTIAKQKDCETVEHYTGKKVTSDEFYCMSESEDVLNYELKLHNAKLQHELNLHAKMALKQSKI